MPVKAKVVICAAAGLSLVLGSAQAGPPVRVSARGGGWCPPARAFCPPFGNSPKVVIFAAPTYYFPSYWGYTSAPFVTTSFSNVSPAFDNDQTGIYRVPAPIISPPPGVVPADTTFGWRR